MTPFTLYWLREDGQGDYDMGTYPTEEAAKAAIPEAKAEAAPFGVEAIANSPATRRS